MPRDWRNAVAVAEELPPPGEEQRPCSRGQWCASRVVAIEGRERTVSPALGYRAFCQHDWDLIVSCLRELPGIYLRLGAEIAQPLTAETSVHIPFGPSIPVRLDIDAAMRLAAGRLAMWEARTRATAHIAARDPSVPVNSPVSVRDAAATLTRRASVLLALQPDWMTCAYPVAPGKLGGSAAKGTEARCRHCERLISRSPVSRHWYAADGVTGAAYTCKHQPEPGTVISPAAPIPADLEAEHGDAEIVRTGADFIGLWVQRDGASAGLEILHLHYWCRAVLRETPARPEELIGVECRACSLPLLRRAEPPWHDGDPEFYSECFDCGDLMSEDDYRMWTGQLAAYHKARLAAMPVLGAAPGA